VDVAHPRSVLRCEECGTAANDAALQWQGHLAYDPREDEAPYAVFYCPTCAAREFSKDEDGC